MTEEDLLKIKEIISGMKCPKGFRCAEEGFAWLCKAEEIGLTDHLKCLEVDQPDCPFKINFAHLRFCQCPLRVYLFKKLKK